MIRWSFGWAFRKRISLGQTDGYGVGNFSDQGLGGLGGRKGVVIVPVSRPYAMSEL